MQFDSGFRSSLRSYVEIVGTEAVLNIPDPFKPGLKNDLYLKRDGKQERIRIKGRELYLGEVEDLCDAIQSGKTPRVTLADSRANIAAILSLAKSADIGKPVDLSDFV